MTNLLFESVHVDDTVELDSPFRGTRLIALNPTAQAARYTKHLTERIDARRKRESRKQEGG